ncbi:MULTISPECIES: amidohydrolase family protein [Hyphomicrobiales]|jgi:cytosine deaminase|uniref:amidohydrolase family protein n=1 Tax=Hyphomicrobiales TaxID=356 RepID=UPI0003783D70|nr:MULTISPECIES: amidohydrolase family protein [Phyllobacteriaceae]MCX8571482.1 amidohydrolase family protein [Aminobacter sp. MET-1]
MTTAPENTYRMDAILGNVRIPRSLLGSPDAFGGRPDRDCIAGNLVIRGGYAVGMSIDAPMDMDLRGRLITQPFVEAHCHLDKCFTAERMDYVGGTLEQAIAAQASDKRSWSREDIAARATRGLQELAISGTRLVRTHVDWEVDPADPERLPLAWTTLAELAETWRDSIVLQRAGLLPIDVLASEDYCDRVARAIARTNGVLGAFVASQPQRRAGIRNMIRAAARHGIALDFHVDEGMDPALDGLEVIATELIVARHEGPVLCGHVCNLGTVDAATRARRIELAATAKLSVAALPSSNLYLQDRGASMPLRRGVTAIRELIGGGVNMVFGTDNVQDAFCPVGTHSPASALEMAVLAAQLEPPFGKWLPCVMGQASSALGAAMPDIDHAAVEDLLLWNTGQVTDIVSAASRTKSVRVREALARDFSFD